MTTPVELDIGQLIKQRKSAVQQRAKEKQLKDFMTIGRANWHNPNGLHPLKILPKELWVMVVNCLKEPHDLQNTMLCCPLFSELLEPRRFTDILFPLAMDIDGFRRRLNSVDCLIPLRVTCRSLREQVDKFSATGGSFTTFYRDPNPDNNEDEDNPVVTQKLERTVTLLKTNGDATRGALRLPRTNWNVGFAIPRLMRNAREDFDAFCELLKRVLELVGGQILHFRFRQFLFPDFRSVGMNATRLYELLHDMASTMPNLKNLVCTYELLETDITTGLQPGPEFAETLRLKPFPTLGKLDAVGMSLLNVPVAADIFESVMRSNPQLKNIAVGFTELTDGVVDAMKTLPLESLSLCIGYKKMQLADLGVLQRLVVERPVWRLKEMIILLKHCAASLRHLFRFLEEFHELETLQLIFEDTLINDYEGLPPLQLPNLKVFRFEYKGNKVGHLLDYIGPGLEGLETWINNEFTLALDYLLMAERLTEVEWRNTVVHKMTNGGRQPFAATKQEMIQFNGGTADLCESNVWEVFPSLRRLSVANHDDKDCLNVYCRGRKVDVVRKPFLC